jgi:hypothetical protein
LEYCKGGEATLNVNRHRSKIDVKLAPPPEGLGEAQKKSPRVERLAVIILKLN